MITAVDFADALNMPFFHMSRCVLLYCFPFYKLVKHICCDVHSTVCSELCTDTAGMFAQ